jgi:hypothetical protein
LEALRYAKLAHSKKIYNDNKLTQLQSRPGVRGVGLVLDREKEFRVALCQLQVVWTVQTLGVFC